MKRTTFFTFLVLTNFVCLPSFADQHDHKGHAATTKSEKITAGTEREITLVNYENAGVKQWIPGVFHANSGDTVKLTLKNTAGAVHGFRIEGHQVVDTIEKGAEKVVTFKAQAPGIYKIDCQLHKAHIGGQFIVH